MSLSWNDYSDAPDQNNFDVIPKGTIAKVALKIIPGGYDDAVQGWTQGYATHNSATGSVYLRCEYTVVEGIYSGRKIWGMIGLYSSKGPQWANSGRALVKAILCSASGLSPRDATDEARAALQIKGFGDLNGKRFMVKIDVEKRVDREDRNLIQYIITPDDEEYDQKCIKGSPSSVSVNTQSQNISQNFDDDIPF